MRSRALQVSFVRQLILLCLHLLALTTAVCLRNPKDDQTLPRKIICHIAEFCVLCGCFISIFALQAKEIYLQGFNYYIQNLVRARAARKIGVSPNKPFLCSPLLCRKAIRKSCSTSARAS